MFVAMVLLGTYTTGHSKLKKPPPGYDSCVDDINNPCKFIIFDVRQVYPAYIIEYT